jgi:hypothetical protein
VVAGDSTTPDAKRSRSRARPRLRKGARRKLAIICAGLGLGGLAAFALESVGTHAQIASTVGAIISGLFAAGDELWERRIEPPYARMERLLRGDVYRNPVLVVFYMGLALFVAANLLAIPSSIAAVATVDLVVPESTQALYVEGIYDDEITQAVMIGSVPLSFVYTIPISRLAAYRIRSYSLVWLIAGVILLHAAGLAASPLIDVPDPDVVWTLTVVDLLLTLPAVVLGWTWARRTRNAFLMSKLYKQLSRTEQVDLIDLVRSLRDVPT